MKPLKKLSNLMYSNFSQVSVGDVPHVLDKITLSLVSENKSLDYSVLPYFLSSQIRFFRDGEKIRYDPIFFVNEFWILKEHYVPVSKSPIQITVDFQPISFMKFQILSQLHESIKQQGTASEFDDMKVFCWLMIENVYRN